MDNIFRGSVDTGIIVFAEGTCMVSAVDIAELADGEEPRRVWQ